jgi:hypothetical protein
MKLGMVPRLKNSTKEAFMKTLLVALGLALAASPAVAQNVSGNPAADRAWRPGGSLPDYVDRSTRNDPPVITFKDGRMLNYPLFSAGVRNPAKFWDNTSRYGQGANAGGNGGGSD